MFADIAGAFATRTFVRMLTMRNWRGEYRDPKTAQKFYAWLDANELPESIKHMWEKATFIFPQHMVRAPVLCQHDNT